AASGGRYISTPRCAGAAGQAGRKPRWPSSVSRRRKDRARREARRGPGRTCRDRLARPWYGTAGPATPSVSSLRCRAACSLVTRSIAAEIGIARLLELERKLGATRARHAPVRQDMHAVGHDVVQEPLIVGDDEHGAVRRAKRVHAFGNDTHSVDVEA